MNLALTYPAEYRCTSQSLPLAVTGFSPVSSVTKSNRSNQDIGERDQESFPRHLTMFSPGQVAHGADFMTERGLIRGVAGL